MCAILGYYTSKNNSVYQTETLNAALEALRHRGPDETGSYEKHGVGLAHARLSIVGLSNGRQPLTNENESLRLVYAGEIFNHRELRKQLEARGHHFRTESDGEVVAHLYEEEGMACLERLNGQFAFALWDEAKRELYLARDRFGILPLFYHKDERHFLFASEIKGLLAFPAVEARVDARALDQMFTFWTTVSPRTFFEGIFEVSPGCYLRVSAAGVKQFRYWDIDFPLHGEYEDRPDGYFAEGLSHFLKDAVHIRLQADVPVGVYLSGGLDSSAVAALAAGSGLGEVETFSVRFEENAFDEGVHQDFMSRKLGLHNFFVRFSEKNLGEILPRAIYHTEAPVLRTAVAPLLALSGLVRDSRFKAVVGGEGADEALLGYDIFKEVKIRMFWAKQPDSARRALLLNRLYPYLPLAGSGGNPYLQAFFSEGLSDVSDPFYSHRTRWRSAARIKRFFSKRLQSQIGDYDPAEDLRRRLHPDFKNWDAMARAQYLESVLFLSGYLLSSQGDRMAMANSVEVRYPYLDHRLVEFCNRIPPKVKMRGLHEKALLRKSVRTVLPRQILERPKYPYRAPGGLSGRLDDPGSEFAWLLSRKNLEETGYFDPELVNLLVEKLKRSKGGASEADQMALTGILTTQLFHDIFILKRSAHGFRH